MLLWIVPALVHAQHDRDIFALCRGGDEDFFRAAAIDMRASFGCIGKEAGRLDYDIDSQVAPRKFARVAFGKDLDSLPVDRERAVAGAHAAVVDAVIAVVFKEVRALLGVDEVVYGGDLDFRMALHDRFGEVSTDAAEAVDSDAHEPRLPGRFRAPLHAAQVA